MAGESHYVAEKNTSAPMMSWPFVLNSKIKCGGVSLSPLLCISNTIGTNDLLGFARTGSKNINDFTEGIFACDLKSVSLHVIMHVLFPAAFIVLLKVWFTHGFLARKSGILNEDEGKLALSFTKNNFSFSLLPFLLLYISIVFLL